MVLSRRPSDTETKEIDSVDMTCAKQVVSRFTTLFWVTAIGFVATVEVSDCGEEASGVHGHT
jgi:hypothetical protein